MDVWMTRRIQRAGLPAVLAAIAMIMAWAPLPADTWMRSYGGAGNADVFCAVLAHPDGGYLAGGVTRAFGDPDGDFYLVRMDADGAVLWERTYGGDQLDYLFDMEFSGDGGCLLLGWTQSFGAGSYEALLIKVDGDGDVLWQKTYGTAAAEYAESILVLADGNLLLAGTTTENSATRGSDLLFLKLDPDGNILSQSAYGSTGGDYLEEAVATADGGWVACGATGMVVAKFNAAGSVEWAWTLGGYGDAVQTTRDGGYLAAGYRNGASGTLLRVARLTSDGTLLWISDFQVHDDYAHADDTATVVEAPDGGAIVSARDLDSHGAESNYNFLLMKVYPGGDLDWWTLFGGTGGEIPEALIPSPEGGYVIVGEREWASPNHDAWIVKTDDRGRVGNGCAYETVPKEWPNQALANPVAFSGNFVTPSAAAAVPAVAVGTPTSGVAEQCRGCDRETLPPDAYCRTTGVVLRDGNALRHTGCDASSHWMSFSACADERFTLETAGLEQSADTILELYAPDCVTLLAQDDDGGGGGASRFSWTSPAAGTYHVRVRQKDGSTGLDRAFDMRFSGDTGPCGVWLEVLGTATGDTVADVRPTSDGGFVFAGTRADPDGWAGDAWIGKTDASGARQWEIALGDANVPDKATAVVESKDGGFIAVGAMTDPATWRSDAWVARIDSAGGLLWLKAYGEADGDDEARRVAEFQDGSILVAGVRNNPDAYPWDLWVFRTTPNGEIGMEVPGSWSIFAGETSQYEEPADLALTRENSFLIVGQSYGSPWPSGRAQALVAAFSCATTGASVARGVVYEAPPWYLHSALNGLTAAPDGSFWAVGEAEQGEDYEPGDLDALVVHMAANGWIYGHSLLSGSAWDRARTAAPWGDGKILVAGETLSFTESTAGWYAVVNATGAIESQEVLDGTDEDQVFSARAVADGSVVLAGRTRSFGAGDADGLMMKIQPGLNGPTPWCAAFSPSTAVTAVATLIETTGWPSSGWNYSYPTTTDLASIQSPVSIITTACGGQRPLEVSPPGAVQALRFGDKTTLVWEDGSLNGADTFNLYAGDLEDLAAGTYGGCLQQDIALPTTTVDETVPAGACRVYLVTGKNMLGEGPLGRDSAGILRINAQPCLRKAMRDSYPDI